jgi:hypothetical protein
MKGNRTSAVCFGLVTQTIPPICLCKWTEQSKLKKTTDENTCSSYTQATIV